MQYQFYKGPEKEGAWKALDVDTMLKRITAPRVAFTTVLSVNIKPSKKEAIGEDALYQGPFYIDIDSDNILRAIKAAKKVLEKLNKSGLPDEAIQLWATGKRGFHFMIPMAYFTKDKPLAKLPLAYKFMASALKLPKETDMTVYSHGRGRMWRVENKQRIDNGAYKVSISCDELRSMTPDIYQALCAAVREPFPAPPAPKKTVSFLAGLFKLSHARALEAVKPVQVYLDPETIEALQGDFPPCAKELLSGKNIKEGLGYNDKSVQIAKATAAFRPNDAEEIVREFAENTEADSYNTVDKRFEHTMKAVKISSRASDYSWSCRSMLSIMKDKVDPCLSCPISFLLNQQDDLIAEESNRREEAHERRKQERIERAKASRADASGGLQQLGTAVDFGELEFEPDFGFDGGADSDSITINRSAGTNQEEPESIPTDEHVFEHGSFAEPDRENEESGRVNGTSAEGHSKFDEGDSEEELESAAQALNDASSSSSNDPPPSSPPPSSFDDDDSDDIPDHSEGLIGTERGYCFIGTEGEERRISNFTLKFTAVFVEFVENLEHDVRTGVKANVFINNKRVGRVILEESCWNSKASFIGHFAGIGNTCFFGKDDDVQKMKGSLMADIESLTENIRRVTSIGLHLTKVGDKQVMTYVEPGWSINSIGMQDTFQLMGQIQAVPRLKTEPLPMKGDPKLREALYALTRVNTDEKVAQIIGWFMAAFLKQHIFSVKNQFPLIGFAGAAGSGKTAQATLFAQLHGINYRGDSSPLSLPNATKFAVWKAIKDTTTVPRIMEEYNKSKLPRTYAEYGEVFKDCWNQFAVQRGALSNSKRHGDNQIGAHLQEFPLTAPVVIISEQHVTMPALVERMIQIPFSKFDLEPEGTREYYDKACRFKDEYFRFAKAAYMAALQISPEQVGKILASYEPIVPMAMGDRPQFSFCVLLTGLDFFKEVCKAYDLDMSDRIENLKDAIKRMVTDDIVNLATSKQRTEVDIVMDKFATMAAMSETDGSIPWLVEGVHYLRVENFLYLDGLVALAQYRSFMNRIENNPPVIEDMGQMKALLKTEPYCANLDFCFGEDFARGRKVWKLDLAKMAAKGIEVSAFVPKE